MRPFIAAALAMVLSAPLAATLSAQGRLADAKSLRCTFPRTSTATWTNEGPQATVGSSSLVLRFEAIDTGDGTAQLRTGAARSDVTVRLAEGYLHLMQAFRTGPLYTTTIFESGARGGKFKAVHSRHEYYAVPLPGATSSPEQYYGDCEVGS